MKVYIVLECTHDGEVIQAVYASSSEAQDLADEMASASSEDGSGNEYRISENEVL